VTAGGQAFLGQEVSHSHPLARIAATSSRAKTSRSVVWGIARQLGHDPTRWLWDGTHLLTWGGEVFNVLLAAILSREMPRAQFRPSQTGVSGPLTPITLSVELVRAAALRAQEANDLPVAITGKFTSPSRFIGELSNALAAEERRRSVPWGPFQRWLSMVSEVDTFTATAANAS
jgi:ATP-dependent helicase Lhr and Lhr-like helicase